VLPDPAIQSEILNYLGQLGIDDQTRVANLARSLATTQVRGTSGKELLRISGTIPHDALEKMRLAIETGCERIESDE
jgi:hypothetical protein